MVSVFDVAGLPDTQVSELVIKQLTTSPLVNVEVTNVGESVPAAEPFTFQAYEGVLPPLVGVAVNVTAEPLQTVRLGVEMLTDTGNGAFTVMVIVPDVAIEGLGQTALLVIST